MTGYAPKPKRKRTLVEFMNLMIEDLAKMQRDFLTVTDPKRRAKLESNIETRTRFIAKLRGQIEDVNQPSAAATRSAQQRPRSSARPRRETERWDWEEITTLPGEFEADYS